MEKITISATDIARSFSSVLNKVRYQGVSFDIKRGKEVVATLSPSSEPPSIKVSELNNLMASLPQFTEEERESFLADIEEIRKNSGKGENKWD